MKVQRPEFINRVSRITVSVCVVVVFGVVGTYAQKTVPQRDLSTNERNLRAIELGTAPVRDSKTILAEVNEDFERLRAINDELKTAAAASGPLNYKSLADNSAEIKKRSTRLKANLAGLPKAEREEKYQKENVPLDEAQMKSLLSSLNVVMTGFLANPVFSDMGTLDDRLALKARRDLDYQIELSEITKKGADRMSKGARQ